MCTRCPNTRRVEQERRERLTHVPLDVIGEHAEKDVGTDPIGQVMVDEADLEVEGLVAAKRRLDVGQVFVGAHGLLGSNSDRAVNVGDD